MEPGNAADRDGWRRRSSSWGGAPAIASSPPRAGAGACSPALERGDLAGIEQDLDALGQARRGDEASALPLAGGDVPRHAGAAGGALRGRRASGDRGAGHRRSAWQSERAGGVRLAALRAALGTGTSRGDRAAAARLRRVSTPRSRCGRARARASSRAARTSRRGTRRASSRRATLPDPAARRHLAAAPRPAGRDLRRGRATATVREVLRGLLEPFAGQQLVAGPGRRATDAAARVVGLLAAMLGRWDEALAQLDRADALNERLGALAWVAQTTADRAAVLLARDAPGDREAARASLAGRGRSRSGSGCSGVARPRTRSPIGSATSRGAVDGAVLAAGAAPRGRSLDGRVRRPRDAASATPRACDCSRSLLRRPGEELHVAALVAAADGAGAPDARISPWRNRSAIESA